MGIAFPDEADEWIEEWAAKLNESDEYADAGEGWGLGFNGDFLFEIRADDVYDGDPVYTFVALEDGECLDAYATDDPAGEDWGFAYRGDYSDWKELVEGDLDPIEGMMDGKFDLDGDMQKVMQYSQAAIVMTENAAEVDTEFAH